MATPTSEKSEHLYENAASSKAPSNSDTDQHAPPHTGTDKDDEKAAHVDSDASDQHDEFEVDWNGPTDPENPNNWSQARKVSIIGLVSFVSFLTPLASSMFAPGIPDVMSEFNTSSNTLATFVVSVYILGFAFVC